MSSRSVCCRVDAVGRTYFFKGDDYWEFSNVHMHVRRGYPRHIGTRWLNCTDAISGSRSADYDSNADRQGPADSAPAGNFRSSTAAVLACLLLLVAVNRR